jgi:hypothetical protein
MYNGLCANLPRSDAVWLTEFVAFPMPLWHIRQLLFWFLSVQLRSAGRHVCADLPRSDAIRLTEFIAFPTPRWHIRQLLFWFLSVQLRTDVQRLLLTCRALMLFGWPSSLPSRYISTLSTSRCLSLACARHPAFHFSRRTTLHRRWGAKPPPPDLPSWQIANQIPSQGEHYASRNFSQQLESVRTVAGLSGSGVLQRAGGRGGCAQGGSDQGGSFRPVAAHNFRTVRQYGNPPTWMCGNTLP